MIKKSFRFLAFAWITLLMVDSCAWRPRQFYDNGVSDEEYISVARLHPAAQVFIELIPQYETYVDRSGMLAVDFRVTKTLPTETTQNWEGIRLRIFIDPNTNQPTEAFIQCNGEIVKSNLEQYLEEYSTIQSCH